MGNDAQNRTPEGMISDILGRLGRLENRLPKSLPDRISPQGQLITNWNDALEDGWYYSNPGALNAPFVDQFVGYVMNQPVGGRLAQRISLPFGNPNGFGEFVRAKSGATWFGWYRSDGRYIGGAGTGTVRFAGTGYYQWAPGNNSAWFPASFLNMPYRAYKITYRTQSATLHRPIFRFLSSGNTQVASADYVSSDWSPAGNNPGAVNTALWLSRDDAYEHSGEFTILNPVQTANTDNRKHGWGVDYAWPNTQTQWGMALQNYDTASLEGFVMYMSASAVISPNSFATISVQGMY